MRPNAPVSALALSLALAGGSAPLRADDSAWTLASADSGSLTISRAGEANWHGTLVYKPAEPDPSFLATPQIPIEIAYRSQEEDTPPPVVLDGQGTQQELPPLAIPVEGFARVVLFARRTPHALGPSEPTHRSLQYVLFFEKDEIFATFSYDSGLTSNRSVEETFDRFSKTLHQGLAEKSAADARGSFLFQEAARFLGRGSALAPHHQLSIEEISVEIDGRVEKVFPGQGDDLSSAVPWSRVRIAVQPGRAIRFTFRVRAAERQAFVDRIGDPVDKPAAGAVVRIEEPLLDGTRRIHEAKAEDSGLVQLAIDSFDNEMKKDFSLFYPPELGLDHQPTFGHLLCRWGRPVEKSLDSGVFELPAFPESDEDEKVQAALIETLFAFYDPDVNQFRKGQRTNTTEELPFFAITLIKWRSLGGELGSRVSNGAIQRFRKTYAHREDYFSFQKYILGAIDAAEARRLLEARVAEYASYPPNRWTLEWADDLLAAISLVEMEKDSSLLPLVEKVADGLLERIRRQPEPSTLRREGEGGWLTGDPKPTRPHAHAAVALARAYTHSKKEVYLEAAFAQADHLMDGHGIEDRILIARIEADPKDVHAFFPSQLASVALTYEFLQRFGPRGARCGEAARAVRTAFLRVLRNRSERLELRDLLEMIRYFFDYYPTGA